MAKFAGVVEEDSTSVIIRVFIARSDTGQGLTGLAYNTSGLIISSSYESESSVTAYASGSSNIEDISALGTYAAPSSGKCRFKEVDSTNQPGTYEIQFADARWGVTAKQHLITWTGASNMLDDGVIYQVDGLDSADITTACETALTNQHLDHLLSASIGASLPGDASSILGQMLVLNGSDEPIFTDSALTNTRSHLSYYGLNYLVGEAVTGPDVTDDSIVAKLVSKEATADWDDYDNTTDSLQALRDTGVELSATGLTNLLGEQLTEGYNADGTAPTLEEALMGLYQFMTERSVSGTTVTVKELDGTTTAMTFTLDNASNPASITRTT